MAIKTQKLKKRGRLMWARTLLGVLIASTVLQGCTGSKKKYVYVSYNKGGVQANQGQSSQSMVSATPSGAASSLQASSLASAAPAGMQAPRAAGSGSGGLRNAVMAALSYSSEVRSAEAALSAAGIDVSIARAGYYPSLAGGAGVGSDGDHDYNVTLSQPIYDWGQTRAEVSGAEASRNATIARARAQREKVMLDAANAYIAVARAREIEKVAQEQLSAYQRIAGLARQRTSAGYGDATEVALAGVHVGEAEATLENARGALRDARSVYASRIGREAPGTTDVPELSSALSSLLRISGGARTQSVNLRQRVDQAPSVVLAQAEAAKANAAISAQKADLFPKLSVEAYVRGDEANEDPNTGVGLRLKGPTFKGLSNVQRVNAARFAYDEATWQVETQRREVTRQVQAYLDQEPTLRARLAILQEQRTKSRELRNLYEEQFKAGTRSLTDLITVQSDLTRIETSLVETRYDLYSLQYEAAGALGMLGSVLNITAPSGNS